MLTALPSSWVYIAVRSSKDYDQSLVDTIVVLPIVVTSIIIIVQNSLALAFVGVTGDLSRPEWGSMISIESQQLFNAPHVILAPGLAITLTVLGFNLLGDGLRDALDPRLNR